MFGSQCAFAVMHVSSHKALEDIPPLPFASIRIAIAVPFLLLSARLQVTPPTTTCPPPLRPAPLPSRVT